MLSERRYYFRTAVLLPMLIGLTSFLCGQEVGNFRGTKDTIKAFVKAAALQRIDTLKKFPERFSTNLRIKKNNIAKSVTSIFDQTANPDTSEIFQTVRKPITFTGGFFIYNTDFRSLIDTPFAEKGIVQHSVSSSLRFNVLNRVPFQVNIYLRETNSRFFKDIYDAQVVFDPVAFRTLFCNTMNSFVSKESDKWKDKSLEKLYTNNFNEGNRLNNFLKDPVAVQKLIEYNELIRVPKVIYDFNLSDSINFRRTDSLMKVASLFVQRYATTKQKYDSLRLQTDSLELAVYKWTSRIQQFRTALQNRQVDATFYKEFAESAKEREIEVNYPKYLEWLLGVRNLAIGRTPLNYSELTTKNVNIKGINFEYNSWYYFAISAGKVDYRFRDFTAPRIPKRNQYLYLFRLGVGRQENSFAILTGISGKKQISQSNTLIPSGVITLKNVSVETKLKINNNIFGLFEVSQSIAPDLRCTPQETKSPWRISNKTSKALAFKFFASFPAIASKIEGSYKYLGANYQSFNSFQSNALTKIWQIRAEQNLFKRKLRLVAAIKSNDYSNPYVTQNYNSTGVSKSFTANLRVKNFPAISIGYVPVNVYTELDNVIYETRFQSLTASSSHFYKLGTIHASTTCMYNELFNSSVDSSFDYYSSSNFLFSQALYFKSYSAVSNISISKNAFYKLVVLEEGGTAILTKKSSITAGLKANTLQDSETKVGAYLSFSLTVKNNDFFSVNFERGYIQTTRNILRLNNIGSVKYIKTFR